MEDGTTYMRAAKWPTLISVYDLYSLSATKISQDFLDFLVNTTVEDLAGVGPTSAFAFVQEHGCLNLGDMKEAQEANTTGASIPTMTPAKRRKDLESPNGRFSTLLDAVALLKDEILVMVGQIKTLGAGSSVGSRAREAEDNGDRNTVQIALEDLHTCMDHLITLSVMAGESLSTLAETVVENRVEEDALQIQNMN